MSAPIPTRFQIIMDTVKHYLHIGGEAVEDTATFLQSPQGQAVVAATNTVLSQTGHASLVPAEQAAIGDVVKVAAVLKPIVDSTAPVA